MATLADFFCLEFDYTNWRGEDHHYLIHPVVGDMTFMDGYWMISGTTIERDGIPRDAGRRTFRIAEMRNVRQVTRARQA